jgi:hypothetical protein
MLHSVLELYLQPPLYLHVVVLNEIWTGAILP